MTHAATKSRINAYASTFSTSAGAMEAAENMTGGIAAALYVGEPETGFVVYVAFPRIATLRALGKIREVTSIQILA